jgi:hypothetical protein
VFYLAHHALASAYVDATDRDIWRASVASYLSEVEDDEAWHPVMALGLATWALAQTGPLDSTLVSAAGPAEPRWDGVRYSDLPDLLLAEQIDTGPYEGCFYWRFDHSDGNDGFDPNHGFTEDTIFGALGLAAVQKVEPWRNYTSQIAAAKAQLLSGIDSDGTVYGHLWENSPDMAAYAGEMLTALSGTSFTTGDADMDDDVGLVDLSILVDNWLASCECCQVDFDSNGVINFVDYAIMTGNWTGEVTP